MTVHARFGEAGRVRLRQPIRKPGTALAIDPLRNKNSFAHPTWALLDVPEAMLVINAARTILHYLDAKLAAGE